jgi:hypothetical protein
LSVSFHRLTSQGRISFVRVLVAVCASMAGWWACAQDVASPEEVEAAYLLKFAGYVEWTASAFASANAPIVVGIVGSDRVYDVLAKLAPGRPVKGRPVEVRRLSTVAQAGEVHLVFVGPRAWDQLADWIAASRRSFFLLVTDAPKAIDRGATLAFVQAAHRIRFEASLTAAEQSRVKLSSRLLPIAERVVGGSP